MHFDPSDTKACVLSSHRQQRRVSNGGNPEFVCLEKINFLGHHFVGTGDVMFKLPAALASSASLFYFAWTAILAFVF